jgi:hypothetical protein
MKRARIVAASIIQRLVRAWKERDVPILLLADYPVMNVMAVVLSHVASGEYYAPKRYLFTSSILLMLSTRIKVYDCWTRRQSIVAGLIGLLLPMSVMHHLRMIEMPDELRDYRTLIAQLEQANHRYGVTWHTYAFALTGLSDEALILSALDHNQREVYDRIVAQQDCLVLVFPTQAVNAPDRARFFGRDFSRAGDSYPVGELSWALYNRLP